MDIVHTILPLKNEMYRLALRITLNSQEAEDVVQDVVIRLWQMRERLDGIDSIEAYALRMTRNLALDRSRMRVNQTESLEDITPPAVTTHDELEADERIDIVRQLMQQLPEKQRTCMHLRDFDGHTYREIADITGLSEEQVKVSIHRARQFIKVRLQADNGML